MPQARTPIAREPSRPAPESHRVARKQLKKSGMYSRMTLKLKVSSMAAYETRLLVWERLLAEDIRKADLLAAASGGRSQE
jgi:hypothetical protein